MKASFFALLVTTVLVTGCASVPVRKDVRSAVISANQVTGSVPPSYMTITLVKTESVERKGVRRETYYWQFPEPDGSVVSSGIIVTTDSDDFPLSSAPVGERMQGQLRHNGATLLWLLAPQID